MFKLSRIVLLLFLFQIDCLTVSLNRRIERVDYDPIQFKNILGLYKDKESELYVKFLGKNEDALEKEFYLKIPNSNSLISQEDFAKGIFEVCTDCSLIKSSVHKFREGQIPLLFGDIIIDMANTTIRKNLYEVGVNILNEEVTFKDIESAKWDGGSFLLLQKSDGKKIVLMDCGNEFCRPFQHDEYFLKDWKIPIPLTKWAPKNGVRVRIGATANYVWMEADEKLKNRENNKITAVIPDRIERKDPAKPFFYILYPFTYLGDILLTPIYTIALIIAGPSYGGKR